MRFSIIKNRPFECIITIKAPGSVTGLPLDPGDTAYFTLSGIGRNGCKYIDLKPMSIYDASNGKFKLELTAEETANLPVETGFKEDSAKSMPTCKGLVEANTASHGSIVGRIPSIFVEDYGTVCSTN